LVAKLILKILLHSYKIFFPGFSTLFDHDRRNFRWVSHKFRHKLGKISENKQVYHLPLEPQATHEKLPSPFNGYTRFVAVRHCGFSLDLTAIRQRVLSLQKFDCVMIMDFEPSIALQINPKNNSLVEHGQVRQVIY
jgi:hypothetical protein